MAPVLTSRENTKIKNLIQIMQKTKARRERGLFVAEGIKMFREAPPNWVRQVFLAKSLAEKDPGLLAQVRAYSWDLVSDALFSQISNTVTPQGILTILSAPSYSAKDLLRPGGRYLVLEDLQDPGNLGTILRTGEGAGLSGLFLTKGCVDMTSPKVVRSTMGSIYRVPWMWVEDVATAAAQLHGFQIPIFAAHLKGERMYDEPDYTAAGCAFLIGNEGNGLSQAAAQASDEWIRIPMEGRVESLNAAMAAGLLLYEAARQERTAHSCKAKV